METLNPSPDHVTRSASPPLDELLDEASGGQPEPRVSANQNASNILELGSLNEVPFNQTETELGHMTENIANHRIEEQVNVEPAEQGMCM